MTRIVRFLVAGFLAWPLVATLATGSAVANEAMPEDGEHGLALSEMRVEIISQGHAAIFQLYETQAAREFYGQLPLTLDLENFRDAQWMFYPPEKLNVTAKEAYHDGKMGELSYYAPWGDVFMLYEDFYAGDEMHRLGVGLSGIADIADMSGNAVIRRMESSVPEEETAMLMTVIANGREIVFELNDSQAARDLYAQLPLSIGIENYSTNEKIFYPPRKLNTSNTPLAEDVRPGTLAYYAPWGDVVLFYGSFHSAPGLYELGNAIQGGEFIKGLSGTIRIERQ